MILGAGAAGIGIARQLRSLFERHGLRGTELKWSIAVVDSVGLLYDGRRLGQPTKREVAWPVAVASEYGLAGEESARLIEVVQALRPTVLIGVSGQADVFTESMVRAMASGVDRPIILPLSNPTSKCEAQPVDLLAWTNG